MAKDKISDYSSTANSNTDIAGINIDEGCAPSGINDAIRTLMAQLKNFQTGTGGDSFNGPFAGTTIAATDTTDASSTTAAAMKTAGGLAVAKKAYIGLDANIYGLTVGRGAGSVSTNTAVGASALAANTTGASNTSLGYQAGNAQTTANDNTFIGTQAGLVATGSTNTGVGSASLGRNAGSTTGTNNAGFGAYALTYLTTGAQNTAIGTSALQNNTTASNNTAVGYQAGYSLTTGAYNTLVGYAAGYSLSGSGNTLNTFVGQSAGYNITTGTKNTIIGTYNGNQGGLNITTASNYIVLSDGDGNPRFWTNGSGILFTSSTYANTTANAANIYVGSANGSFERSTSALKYKQNIRDLEEIDINLFRPVRYNSKCDNDDKTKDHFGIISDEVHDAGITELVNYNSNGEVEGFQYERLTVVLLKKLQVLESEFKAYKEAHP